MQPWSKPWCPVVQLRKIQREDHLVPRGVEGQSHSSGRKTTPSASLEVTWPGFLASFPTRSTPDHPPPHGMDSASTRISGETFPGHTTAQASETLRTLPKTGLTKKKGAGTQTRA